MNVFSPNAVRMRLRALASEGGLAPLHSAQKKQVRQSVEAAIGRLFPPNSRDREVKILWNAVQMFGYIFGAEDEPFTPLHPTELSVGAWVAVGRWCGVVGGKNRPGFDYECLWLANRGLWCKLMSERFFRKPPLADLLERMDAAYGTQPIDIEENGMVQAALEMRAEPVPLTEHDITILLKRWREGAGAAQLRLTDPERSTALPGSAGAVKIRNATGE